MDVLIQCDRCVKKKVIVSLVSLICYRKEANDMLMWRSGEEKCGFSDLLYKRITSSCEEEKL